MSNAERTLEVFEVTSEDGQRVQVRKSLLVHVLRNLDDPKRPVVKLNRTVYCALARGGLERPVEPLGDNRFRIAGKEFARLGEHAEAHI